MLFLASIIKLRSLTVWAISILINNLDKKMDSAKDVERAEKLGKKKESSSSGSAVDTNNNEKSSTDLKGNAANQKGNGSDRKVEKTDGSETGVESNAEKRDPGETASAQTTSSAKPGKRKIIRRIVKQKVVDKAAGTENIDSTQNNKLDEKNVIEKNAKSDISGQQEESSAEPAGVKTFTRKKVAKKAPAENTAQSENKDIQLELKAEEKDQAVDKPKDDSVPSSVAAVQDTGAKTTIKKKIIKRVLKRKVTGKSNDAVVDTKIDENGDQRSLVQTENETGNINRQTADTEKKASPEMKSKMTGAEKLHSVANSPKTEIQDEKEDKDRMGADVKTETGKERVSPKDISNGKKGKSKDEEKSKDEKAKNDRDGKDESRSNSNKEGKEKRKPEEPPRHPGLILQTKWSKDSKVGSL